MKRLFYISSLFFLLTTEALGQVVSPPSLYVPGNNFVGTSIRPRIDWGNVTGVNGYFYQADTTPSFNSPILIDLTQNNTSSQANLPLLRYGTKYYWRVAARSATDTSAWSAVSAFTTIDQFGLFFPTDNATTITTSPTISWSNLLWSSHYIYELDRTPAFNSPNKISGNTAGLTGISGRRATFTGLLNGQEYFWRVAAVSAIDTSSWSVIRKFTTLYLLTTPPAQLSPVNAGINVLRQGTTLDWDTVLGANMYHLQLSTTNNFSATRPIISVVNSQFTPGQLNNFTTYYWRVRASNALGNSPWSSVWSFTTEDCITNDTIVVSACSSYQLNGMVYTASGFYSQTLMSSRGCDSIVNINLTINAPSDTNLTRVACDNYVLNNQMYFFTGNYTQTIQNSKGCDSTILLNLTILNNAITTVNISTCNSYTWSNTGLTYRNSGVYFDTLQSSIGCDSTVVLTLTIIPSPSSLLTASVCDSFSWRGSTFLQTGIYTDTILNPSGCDSVLILSLTVNQSVVSIINQSACGSYTWAQNGQTYTSSGIYQDTLITISGCDSVTILDLMIDSSDNSVSQSGFVLTANQVGASYQWLDCSNGNTPIFGATDSSFVATSNGDYSVEVTKNSCVDTSSCITVISVGLENIEFSSSIQFFPNPATKKITLNLHHSLIGQPVEIYNLSGKLVKSEFLNSDVQTIDIRDLPNAVYFIRYGNELFKLVVAHE